MFKKAMGIGTVQVIAGIVLLLVIFFIFRDVIMRVSGFAT